ncbi:ABC transporter permease [Mesorhizobium sp. M7A.F.Ca.CA.001.09.2.1]|uniref:ABC transporter permease n=3 Tax=Mesorhizobium TaxID=68287 RepID=A0AB38TA41_9HYPH|nr:MULTISPECIES: ABC transporter permease [Mesorhizobium]RUY46272.1 ABC transporter permease [Mesorhizobium sp. M7A.F.Ca.CA.001.13.2.1]RUZ91424.1 ABC transporter permease [Mesorhizobium sp. M7A.F.Ca.US.003.02.2.1]MDF3217014.1 ABC transporter permease [Mesorhizobium ciceri]RUY64080.1 ABC transporter permease [Mesorhizobium sp. M7A.F.Ca.CA.001.05.1.1]RUY72991.1 ABC transporter permease [Mesorhizobium sp. M7A.F.Ca.CA.001.13.1.1]
MLARDPSPPPLPAEGPIVAKPAHGNESYMALVWRRLKRSWTGMAGLWLVVLLLVMAVFAEFIAPMDPKVTDVGFAPPQVPSFHDRDGGFTARPRVYALADSADLDPVTFQPVVGPDYDHPRLLGFFVHGAPYKLFGLLPADRHLFGSLDGQPVHFLGTDKFGRDVLSRAIHGSRVSLMIALTVVFIITVIGTTVGMVSGYFGGRFDVWMQRFVELVLAFPQLPLYLALTTLIPVTAPTNVFLAFVIIVMSALGWAQMSREVRGKTLALARIEYVRAAMAVGATDRRIIMQHIFPNVMSHVIVAVTLAIPTVVLLESFLGFLGFAVKPPLISWGLMLQDTATYSVIGTYPWILSPVGFVLVTVFAFNALGDGLRDAVDPY